MNPPRPSRRKLTAAQKKAGITLVKGWRKPDEKDPTAIYRCFPSPARIKNKKVKIGIAESQKLHWNAIARGMATKRGRLRPNLTWQEKLVITLRQVTSPPAYNHEWWGAKTMEPKWVHEAERIYNDSWLWFTPSAEDLLPRKLGHRVGYFLILSESKLELAASDKGYLSKIENIELSNAQRGLDPKERKKVSVVFPDYDSLKQFVDESYQNALQLRTAIVSLVAAHAPLKDFNEFFEGFVAGKKKAVAIDLKDELSEYNRTKDVIDIMLDHWPAIDSFRNRTEISEYIRDHLPDTKKKFLKEEKAKRGAKDESPWKDFRVWMRDIYDDIGLRPSGKGRPRKNGDTQKN
jgi:hypothetical protein